MPLLPDVRSLFRKRQKPVEIDLTGTQAERLAAALGACGAEEDEGFGPIETPVAEPRAASKAERGQDEIMGLVHKIGNHLDGQSDNAKRMLGLLDRLPHALDSLPELNRQNAHMLEAMHDHFSQAKVREEALNDTLGAITKASDRQAEVLGLVQQQLDTTSQTAAQLNDTLGSLHQALGDLAESNAHSTTVLSEMASASREQESELSASLGRSQRWMVAAVFLCGFASLIAVLVAAAAMLR